MESSSDNKKMKLSSKNYFSNKSSELDKKIKSSKRNESESPSRHSKRRHECEEEEKEKQKKKSKQDAKLKSKKDNEEHDNTKISNGGGGDLSLSIEETNKLRAKLGLKPLSITETNKTTDVSQKIDLYSKKTYLDKDTNQEFEHLPAKNIAEIKEQKDFKQKLEEQREKRRFQEKLRIFKGLGDDSEEEGEDLDYSAQLWIKKQKEKDEARKKEIMLQEMDEQFVDDLNKFNKKPQYTANNLKGIKVEHDQSNFKEGQEIILTLKDKSILRGTGENLDVDDEDEGDVLINLNILDDEKAAKNNENKKKKSDYKPYDDFDEDVILKERSILEKYNEDLNGEKKKFFKLGAKGLYDANDEKLIQKLNEELKSKAIKLDIKNDFNIANDYLTQDELEKFKKPKKVRKVLRKNKILRADDLLPLQRNSSSLNIDAQKTHDSPFLKTIAPKKQDSDSLSNNFFNDVKDDLKKYEKNNEIWTDEDNEDEIDIEKLKKDNNDFLQIIEEENNFLDELQSVLNKTRKRILETQSINLKEIREPTNEDAKKDIITCDKSNAITDKNIDEDEYKITLTLDTMSEFCRNLGNIPIVKDREEESNLIKTDKLSEGDEDEEVKNLKPSNDQENTDEENEFENSSKAINLNVNEEDGARILDNEPVIDRGLASALKLAVNKGYLVKEKEKQNARLTKANIEAQYFTIEEKNYYDIDDKYNRQRDRFSGPLTDFEEKSNYKPDVKLDYIDEKGHSMNEKEAFRYLSHRFHGKGSGKKKTEKRFKKLKEQEAMNKMTSSDTPLNTVALLVEKQKKLQQPFVVLSTQKGKQDQITLPKR